MRKPKTISLTVFLLLACSAPSLASWSIEGALWSSPYHHERILVTGISYTWKPIQQLAGTLWLPVQRSSEWELLPLQLQLCWERELNTDHSLRLELAYARNHPLAVEGTIKVLQDPLLAYYSFRLQKKNASLGIGVIFAANERWALGAHLQYTQNSLLTYQLYRTTEGDHPLELSYAYSLDGTLQRLGLKIPF